MTTEFVDVAELELLGEIPHDGGNSSLHRCRYGGRGYLFKRFRPHFLSDLDELALRDLVRWRERLAEADRTRLDTVTAWPRRIVVSDDNVLGVLLVEAPAEFTWQPGPDEPRRARGFTELISFTGAGRPRPGAAASVRRNALAAAIEVLVWLHGLGVLMVDVQADNILTTADGTRVLFLDCDVAWGPWGRPASASAPNYMQQAIPRLKSPTVSTDLGRLAWLAIWALTDNNSLAATSAGMLSAEDEEFLRERLAATTTGDTELARWRRLAAAWTTRPVRAARTSGVRLPHQRRAKPRRRGDWLPPDLVLPEIAGRLPEIAFPKLSHVLDPAPPAAPRRSRMPLVALSAAAVLVLLMLVLKGTL
ncbi:hypothetical protein [Catellatospora sp. NPDC049609]|uniref:hypothetical protein n=1 Tax=Catellatospora sp. NPDC049609 TaxID=3155505 RepID=UPI00341D700C